MPERQAPTPSTAVAAATQQGQGWHLHKPKHPTFVLAIMQFMLFVWHTDCGLRQLTSGMGREIRADAARRVACGPANDGAADSAIISLLSQETIAALLAALNKTSSPGRLLELSDLKEPQLVRRQSIVCRCTVRGC